jgi:hypothetical protein
MCIPCADMREFHQLIVFINGQGRTRANLCSTGNNNERPSAVPPGRH